MAHRVKPPVPSHPSLGAPHPAMRLSWELLKVLTVSSDTRRLGCGPTSLFLNFPGDCFGQPTGKGQSRVAEVSGTSVTAPPPGFTPRKAGSGASLAVWLALPPGPRPAGPNQGLLRASCRSFHHTLRSLNASGCWVPSLPLPSLDSPALEPQPSPSPQEMGS